eukprot:g3540.t1
MEGVYNAFRRLYDNYVVVMLVAAIVHSATRFSVKLLSEDDSVFQILFIRGLFLFSVLSIAIYKTDGKYFGEPETYRLMFLRGLVGCIGLILGTFATFLLPFVDSAFLLNIYPVTTALIAFILKFEQPSFRCWLGVFGCVIGVAIISEPPFLFGGDEDKWDLQRVAGLLTALIAQTLMGATFVIMKMIGESASVAANALAQSIGVLVISIPFLPTSFPKRFNSRPSLEHIGLYILMATTALAFQTLLARGFQIGPPVKCSILLLSSLMYSALFGIFVLSENASAFTVIGAGVITASVILVIVYRSSKVPDSQENVRLLSIEDDPTT